MLSFAILVAMSESGLAHPLTAVTAQETCRACVYMDDYAAYCQKFTTREECNNANVQWAGLTVHDCKWDNSRGCRIRFLEPCETFVNTGALKKKIIVPLSDTRSENGLSEVLGKNGFGECKKIELLYHGHGIGHIEYPLMVGACSRVAGNDCQIQANAEACSTFQLYSTKYETQMKPIFEAIRDKLKPGQTVTIDGNTAISTREHPSKMRIVFSAKSNEISIELNACHPSQSECYWWDTLEWYPCLDTNGNKRQQVCCKEANKSGDFGTWEFGDQCDTTKYLLKRAIDEENLKEPLSDAISRSQIKLVKDLLDQGIKLNVQDLMTAVMYTPAGESFNPALPILLQHLSMRTPAEKQALLEARLKTRTTDNGRTPLLYAVSRKQVESVKLLLAAGADPTAQDAAGYNALQTARVFRYWNNGKWVNNPCLTVLTEQTRATAFLAKAPAAQVSVEATLALQSNTLSPATQLNSPVRQEVVVLAAQPAGSAKGNRQVALSLKESPEPAPPLRGLAAKPEKPALKKSVEAAVPVEPKQLTKPSRPVPGPALAAPVEAPISSFRFPDRTQQAWPARPQVWPNWEVSNGLYQLQMLLAYSLHSYLYVLNMLLSAVYQSRTRFSGTGGHLGGEKYFQDVPVLNVGQSTNSYSGYYPYYSLLPQLAPQTPPWQRLLRPQIPLPILWK